MLAQERHYHDDDIVSILPRPSCMQALLQQGQQNWSSAFHLHKQRLLHITEVLDGTVDFCLVIESNLSEQIAAISFCSSWPTILMICALVTLFFSMQLTANDL